MNLLPFGFLTSSHRTPFSLFYFVQLGTGVLVAYGCPKHEYNPSATLLLHSMDKTLKSLFARGFHYQYDCEHPSHG
jgi:hypothetical protein